MQTERQTIARNCPVCSSTTYNVIRTFPDGVLVGRCNSCSTIYTPLAHAKPESLLTGESFEKLVRIYEPVFSGKKKHFRQNAFEKYLRVVKKYSSGIRLLDVGCAHGFFAREAGNHGFKVAGIEPSESYAHFAEKINHVRMFRGTLANVKLNDEQWNAITFTDSLEYIPDPVIQLAVLKANLDKDGILFIKVPNGASFDFRWKWSKRLGWKSVGQSAFTPSLRVVHYTHSSLEAMLRKAGYQVVKQGQGPLIHSPDFEKSSGANTETATEWWQDFGRKFLRRCAFTLGSFLSIIHPKFDVFSVSIYAVAVKNSTPQIGNSLRSTT